MDVKGDRFEILILLDSDYHLLQIVGGDVAVTSTASAADRILSVDLWARDTERVGGRGGGRCLIALRLEFVCERIDTSGESRDWYFI